VIFAMTLVMEYSTGSLPVFSFYCLFTNERGNLSLAMDMSQAEGHGTCSRKIDIRRR